ncbi:hypothetical protein, partial [Kocuria rosea]|uniref:hypothetical protein n=1 Tax=Kocuria rosea TaxID=1275 RepID=UPI00203AB884|nr:hypothetical protein [Kocuria rosea]
MSPTANTTRTYDVVAMSFPIVYSPETDYDPNGLLYTLRVYQPLLEWAKQRWEDNDEYLPKLLRRSQLMETVVAGLPRFQRMREILSEGPQTNRYLLREFGEESEVHDRETRDAQGPPLSPHDRAIRQNYRSTVDDLVSALRELTRGRIVRLVEDPATLEQWRITWLVQLQDAERAIEAQLVKINSSWPALLTDYRQQYPQSPRSLSDKDIKRLLFNDHSPGNRGLGENTPAYDWFNPLKPIPLVRPLVLRACQGEELEIHFENSI